MLIFLLKKSRYLNISSLIAVSVFFSISAYNESSSKFPFYTFPFKKCYLCTYFNISLNLSISGSANTLNISFSISYTSPLFENN